MQNTEVIELLKRPEGKTLEFKQELSSKSNESLAKTICAFANTAGGNIVFGIEDKTKHVFGVSDPQTLEEQLTNIIDSYIEPKIIPTIETCIYEQYSILIVRIYPNSPLRPYFLKKEKLEMGTYVRIGSTNRRADPQTIRELQRLGEKLGFEEEPFFALDSRAIDLDAITKCFAAIRQIKESDLISFNLLVNCQGNLVPTNAGMILFGKERERYFPNAKIKAARFRGLTRDQQTLDSRDIDSYLVIAVQDATDFIKKHANYESELSYSSQDERWNTQRSDRWNIPVAAIREAIINAVVHADYLQKGSCIHVFIYQDRIEIENPGLLVTGLDIEDITKGISKLRNPIIGNIFNKLGLIEQYGSGINKIFQECERYGLKQPKFEEFPPSLFRVTIYTTPQKSPLLSDLDNTIVDVLRYQYFSNPTEGLSTKDITTKADLSQRATRNHLLSLVSSGFVVEISKGPGDPKKKYFLKEEYAKIPTFIAKNKRRQDLEDIINSGILADNQKIKHIEEILKIPSDPLPVEWDKDSGFQGNINCYAFAFGLANFKSYQDQIVKAALQQRMYDRRSFASSLFVKDYIKNKALQELDYPYKGCLALYLDKDENPVHAAIVKETLSITAQSKWGTFDVIFTHKLRDVPICYGSLIKFYPPIDPHSAYDFFETWSNGAIERTI